MNVFGKILVAFVPTLITSLIADFVYILIINYLTLPLFTTPIILTSLFQLFLIQACIIGPLFSWITINSVVWISMKVKGFREAQQLGGLVIGPMMTSILRVWNLSHKQDWMIKF